jgi:hypothetical protein
VNSGGFLIAEIATISCADMGFGDDGKKPDIDIRSLKANSFESTSRLNHSEMTEDSIIERVSVIRLKIHFD